MRKSEIRPTDTNKMGDVIAREKEGKGLVMVIQDDLSPKKHINNTFGDMHTVC